MKKTILFSVVFAAMIFLGGCGKQPVTTPDLVNTANNNQPVVNQNTNNELPTSATIVVKDFKFTPNSITVKKGAIITWANNDSANHQVVADSVPAKVDKESLKSNSMFPGQTWSFTIDESGTYTYHCSIHPSMTGVIIAE